MRVRPGVIYYNKNVVYTFPTFMVQGSLLTQKIKKVAYILRRCLHCIV